MFLLLLGGLAAAILILADMRSITVAKQKVLLRVYSLGPSQGAVVEVGTSRSGQWPSRDGHSTLLWAELCRRDNREFISIDINRQHLERARDALGPCPATLIEGDAIDVLPRLQYPIAVLYLDGADAPEQALAQYHAAANNLLGHAVVVIDDCHSYAMAGSEGKGTMLLPYLRSGGYHVTIEELRPGRPEKMGWAQRGDRNGTITT